MFKLILIALQSVTFSLTTMLPPIPPGVQVELVQLDGSGPKEIIAYDPRNGATYVAWIKRDQFGGPYFCVDQTTLPSGYTLKIGNIDPWDWREDVVLVPQNGGPLVLGGTNLHNGPCYYREE